MPKRIRRWPGNGFAGCEQFGNLRQKVEEFDGFQELQPHNYDFSSDHTELLVSNLVNTEIDIVLESSQKLYIGEAKFKSGFEVCARTSTDPPIRDG